MIELAIGAIVTLVLALTWLSGFYIGRAEGRRIVLKRLGWALDENGDRT